jgi:predicted PurR-regulated permease PerM
MPRSNQKTPSAQFVNDAGPTARLDDVLTINNQENENEDEELLHASIKIGAVAQVVIAIIAAVGLIYLLKLVMVTALVSVLLSFVLDPLVTLLAKARIPRAAGAFVAVALLVVVVGFLTFYSYNQAVGFAEDLPKYSSRLRDTVGRLRNQTQKLEESTRSVLPDAPGSKKAIPVEVHEAPRLSTLISTGASQFGEVVLAITFIPFLVYFMLTWKVHVHSSTLGLFPKEHRLVAYRTIGRISAMIRSFIAGNLLLGMIAAVVSTSVFWAIGLPYPYFLGILSGFVGLIPYLGIILGLLAPFAAGLGSITPTSALIIVVTVIGMHILTMNVLYPLIIGKRLRLNPLALSLSLLFWAWVWGAMGLILAVPIMGATKIVCDYVDSLRGLGAWLGDS